MPLIRNAQTGEERTVRAGSVPFFTNQGYELVDEPAPATPSSDALSELRAAGHDAAQAAADLAQVAEEITTAATADPADPGASTTSTP